MILRLVSNCDNVGDPVSDAGESNVEFDATQRAIIVAEGKLFEAQFGRCAYSEFLQKNGNYPAPMQASLMGRLIGVRVRAADNKFYPKNSRKRPYRDAKHRPRQKPCDARYVAAKEAWAAIEKLASIIDQVPEIHQEMINDPYSLFVPEAVPKALSCLERFAAEIERHGQQKPDQSSEFIGKPRPVVGGRWK